MNRHLTEEEIAMCAEALENGSYNSLPQEIRAHVAECDQCADEILTVADIAGDIDLKIVPQIPRKDKTQRIIAWSASVAAAIALTLLLIDIGDKSSLNQDGSLLTQEKINTEDTSFEKKKIADENLKAQTEETEKDESISSDKGTQDSEEEKSIIADNHQKESEQTEDGTHSTEMPATGAPTAEMPSTGAPTVSTPQHLRDDADTLKFLAHFKPNDDLEKLVERYQGNLRGNENIEIETPLSVKSSKSSVTIKWKNPDRKRLIIEIFDHQGERILETETTREEYTIDHLEDGLYYWKLISENFELLFCGKIIVRTE